jgi:major membrane immunogen (membrane-anchored lipoprotein)
MKTKFAIIFSLILMILLTTCDKKDESTYTSQGVITGFDPRDCACCGGLLINLNSSSTELFTDSTYQIDKAPENFNFDGNTIFPVFIWLDYERTNALCGKTIDITRFEIK